MNVRFAALAAFCVGVAVHGAIGTAFAAPSNCFAPHSLSIGTTVGTRAFERLGEADPRPTRRGELCAGVEIGYQLGRSIRSSIQGHLGGSFFDFEGAFMSGNAPEQSWGVRLGLDWLPWSEGRTAVYLGLSYEYGEARSWTNTPIESIEGPRNYLSGAGARAGLAVGLNSRLRVRSEILMSGYYAHTFDERLDMRYRWLGSSSGMAVGLDFNILRGNE